MIEERATELFEEKIKPVDELIRYYQAEQYKINVSDSDRIIKLGFSINQSNEEMRKRIDDDFKEQLLSMNIAIALLRENLATVGYNSTGTNGMLSRNHLDDFNDNFKEVVLKINMPGKDSRYKEQLVNNYFSALNNCSTK